MAGPSHKAATAAADSRRSTARLGVPVPPDGGWGWMVLLGAFVAYFIADGWSYTFGLFFPVFLRQFQASRGHTAAIGAMVYGVPRLVSPVVCAIINACGCRPVAIMGGVITGVAFVLSTFATSIDYLCITLGLLASMGFATIYITSLVTVTFYFERRRGLATALAATGSGLGAFAFPPLMEVCLGYYSWRGTLLLLGGICFHIIAAGALFRPPPVEIIQDGDSEDGGGSECPGGESDKGEGTSEPPTTTLPTPEDLHKQVPYMEADMEVQGGEEDRAMLSHSSTTLNKQLYQVISISSWSLATAMSSTPHLARRHRSRGRVDKEGLKTTDGHIKSDVLLNKTLDKTLSFTSKDGESPKAPSCPDLSLTRSQPQHQETTTEQCTSLSFMVHSEESSTGKVFKKLCFDLRLLLSNICDKTLLFNKSYLLFCASSFVFYLFVVVPYVYLVDRVTLLGFSDGESAMLLSIIGIGRTLGQIVLGCLGDVPKVNSIMLYSVAIATTGIGTLIIPVCVNFAALCAACAVFGFAVSVTYVLQMICVVQMVGLPRATNAFGMFQLIPGVATLMGTPIAGLMYEAKGDYDLSFYVAGSLIFVSGCVLLPLPFMNSRTTAREAVEENLDVELAEPAQCKQ